MTITTDQSIVAGRDTCDTYDVSADQIEPRIYPTAVVEGVTYLVCPVGGFDCAHIERNRQGLSSTWARDVIDVHVKVSHTRWS